MPFFNVPRSPRRPTQEPGWIDSGLSAKRTVIVSEYKRYYSIHNRSSRFLGAIVLKGRSTIHAGPEDLSDVGYGSAGCVEIVGDFDVFKADIQGLSGTGESNADDAISQLVKARKLIVEIEQATVPDIKKLFTRQIKKLT